MSRPDGIQYSPNWMLRTGSGASARSNNTYHPCVTPRSNLVYFFQGDAIYYYADRNFDHGSASVAIDGARWDEVNSTAPSLQTQQLLWSKTGLGTGDHQIVISHIGTQGQYIGLDYLRIESNHGFVPDKSGPAASSIPSGAFIVDDTDPSVSYSSNWTIVESGLWWGAYYGNSLHATRHPGSTVTFKFNGTAVWYFSDIDVPHGNVQISVDGGPANTTSGYSSVQLTQRLIWSRENLEDKEHTVVITHADSDGSYATLDFFMYLPSGVSPKPGTDKKSASTAAIAGGAAGGAAILIIAAVLLFLFFKRQQRRKNRTSGNLDFFDDASPVHHGQPTNAEVQPLFQVTPFTHTPSPEQQYQPYQPSNATSTGYFERSPVTSEGTTSQRREKAGMGYLSPSTVPTGTSTFASTSGSGASSQGRHDDAPPAYI
ncbi:hypothetical protein BDV93DRAFT_525773 [Ceratobasidium sp. AG-I]|nr:hypothetical protein BDV93DRAFT_525773 [Ceratobasidium sp. AG-I]